MSDNKRPKQQWGTKIGVVFAVAGSAVGLGNFLRFPGNAAQNGGGAFMIPYLISLFVMGIPLCWAEWTMGRFGGSKGFNSAPGTFTKLWSHPFSKYLGSLAVVIPLIIYCYYVVIEAWCLGYAYHYLMGHLDLGSSSDAYQNYFVNFVGLGENGNLINGNSQGGLIYFIILVFFINFLLIYKGVQKGIEKLCTYAIPLMAVCAFCVLIRVLTLGTPDPQFPDRNVLDGLGYMWNPDFSRLGNFKTWLAAAGQVFFSLSVGFGVMLNYASYLNEKDDVVLSGLTSSSLNEFFEVCLGGMITLPAAFIFIGTVNNPSTFGLGFNALPNVFAMMPGGTFFGFLWFFMLFLAAITSSISMLQPVFAFFEEGVKVSRNKSLFGLLLLAVFGTGLVVYCSKNLLALDTFDFWVGTFALTLLALIEATIYGWVWGTKKGSEEMHRGAKLKVPNVVQFLLKYVTPVYLIVILGGVLWSSGKEYMHTLSTEPVARTAVLFVLAVLVLFLFLIRNAAKLWKERGV